MADRAVGIPVAREGVPFVLAGVVPTAIAFLLGWTPVGCVLGSLTLFVSWFFRNPSRTPPPGDQTVVAPGDGKVIAVQEEFEPRFIKDQAIRISIFLNVFDVHINRIPCAGTIMDIAYQPGQFMAANRAEATIRNEQNALMIETSSHQKVLCSQVAGLIARRIVCWAKPGDSIQTGERFGLIRFGSRVDLFLPKRSKITIEVGDRVKGGESVLGELVCVDPS
jgi:phosphatidylserine decarboxylase